MPKVDEPTTNFKFSITNVPKNTAFAVYLQDSPRRFTQNTITTGSADFEIPSTLSGPGYITFSIPRQDRLNFSKNLKFDFDLHGDTVINLSDHLQAQASTTSLPTEPKKLIKITKTHPSKKLVTNQLQAQVQAAKAEINDDSAPKTTFWDKFK